jgi:hypothetical protein
LAGKQMASTSHRAQDYNKQTGDCEWDSGLNRWGGGVFLRDPCLFTPLVVRPLVKIVFLYCTIPLILNPSQLSYFAPE